MTGYMNLLVAVGLTLAAPAGRAEEGAFGGQVSLLGLGEAVAAQGGTPASARPSPVELTGAAEPWFSSSSGQSVPPASERISRRQDEALSALQDAEAALRRLVPLSIGLRGAEGDRYLAFEDEAAFRRAVSDAGEFEEAMVRARMALFTAAALHREPAPFVPVAEHAARTRTRGLARWYERLASYGQHWHLERERLGFNPAHQLLDPSLVRPLAEPSRMPMTLTMGAGPSPGEGAPMIYLLSPGGAAQVRRQIGAALDRVERELEASEAARGEVARIVLGVQRHGHPLEGSSSGAVRRDAAGALLSMGLHLHRAASAQREAEELLAGTDLAAMEPDDPVVRRAQVMATRLAVRDQDLLRGRPRLRLRGWEMRASPMVATS